jgi:hypothetical protein
MLASEPGIATHELGNTLALIFSNIPFLDTKVARHLHTTSDHDTLITVVLITTGSFAAKPSCNSTVGPFVLNTDLELLAKYVSLVRDGTWILPSSAETTQELDELAAAISGLLIDALQAFGYPCKGPKEGAK